MSFRRVFLLWCGAALATISLACNGGAENDETNSARQLPLEDVSIQLAVPESLELKARWDILLEEWSAQTGAQVSLLEYELPPATADSAAWIAALGGKGALPTLVLAPLPDFPKLASESLLAPIGENEMAQGNLNWLDLFQGLRDNICQVARQPQIIPVSSPTLVCYYRSDLLQAAGKSVPQTWEQYQTLLDELDAWAPGLTAVEPWGEGHRGAMFFSRAAAAAKHPGNYSFFFDITSGASLLDSPGFVKALERSRAAIARMPADVLDYTPADARREILEGRAAIAIAYETVPPEEAAVARADVVEIGVAPLPGEPEVYNLSTKQWERTPDGDVNLATLTAFNGLAAGVTAESEPIEQQAAWNLFKALSMEQLEAAFPPSTRSPVRQSHIDEVARWLNQEMTAGEALAYVRAVGTSLKQPQVVALLPVADRHRFLDAFAKDIVPGLKGDGQPAEVLGGISKQWTGLAEEIGLKTFINQYRNSLGLSQSVVRSRGI